MADRPAAIGPHMAQSLERLAALSDGVFAVVLTLLVLDLRTPAVELSQQLQPVWADGALDREAELWKALAPVLAHLAPYFLSFLILGVFWISQQSQFNHMVTIDRQLTWIHLFLLLFVSLMPYLTRLLAANLAYRIPFLAYWADQFLLSMLLLMSLRYAGAHGMWSEAMTPAAIRQVESRILRYQALYFGVVVLSLISTVASLAVLIVLQLNAALAPPTRWRPRRRACEGESWDD